MRISDWSSDVCSSDLPDSDCPQTDLDNLKRKLDAGATRAITQFFFSPDSFLRFRDAAAAAGIDAPIIPGILPVSNVSQTRRMADMCGTAIPAWMVSLFDGLDDHPAARQLVSATIAAEMCRRPYAGGVRDFHFYPLTPADQIGRASWWERVGQDGVTTVGAGTIKQTK